MKNVILSKGLLRRAETVRQVVRCEGSSSRNAKLSIADFLTLLGISCSWILLTMHGAWVYSLTNNRHTVLYVGVTNNLATRLWNISQDKTQSVLQLVIIEKLTYYEGFPSLVEAIARESSSKKI